jgi:cobalt/nickel transport system permease protein
MHIGNGTVTPGCAVLGLAIAAAVYAGAALLRRREIVASAPRPLAFAGAVAGVFAAQAFNVPVLPGVSGHMVGAFLLALWFGPMWGLAGMTLVLVAQTLLFADGGLLTLGLNLLNMGILPCLLVYPLWKRLAGDVTGAGRYAAIFGGAATATLVSAAACAMQLASVGGLTERYFALLPALLGVHGLIAIVEGLLTVGAVGLVVVSKRAGVPMWAGPVGAAALAGAAVLGASPWPDGLEHSLERHGFEAVTAKLTTQSEALQSKLQVFADYTFVPTVGSTLLLFAAALGLAIVLRRMTMLSTHLNTIKEA